MEESGRARERDREGEGVDEGEGEGERERERERERRGRETAIDRKQETVKSESSPTAEPSTVS